MATATPPVAGTEATPPVAGTEATPPVAGTAEVTPQVPGRRDMEAAVHVIKDNADRLFLWDYERDRGQLVTLYNKAMGSQWNSVTDLDWSIDVDPERLVAEQDNPLLALSRVAGTLPGSPMASWTEKEYSQLGIEFFKANLSQFMHGEQGAMMTAAKIVETVPWIDAKYYASTQTMDEARHTEVFAKYLRTKLGDAYPMSPFLKEQIWSLLEDSRWDIAYLGMQIVIESLALAAFGDMLRRTKEPLLTKLLRYVMSDEARHVAFGVLTLSEFYRDLSEAELKERQEFLVDATLNSRSRATTPEVWERMGTTGEDVFPFIMQAAEQTQLNPMRGFARGFFAKLVPNVRKLGLLDANNGYLRERWGEAGPARVRVRRRHRVRLRVLRRGGAGPGGAGRAAQGAEQARRRKGERGTLRHRAGAGHLPGAPRGRGAPVRRPHRPGIPGAGQALRDDERGRHVHDAEGTPRGATGAGGLRARSVLRPEVRRAQGLGRGTAGPPGRARLGRDGGDDRRELLPHRPEAPGGTRRARPRNEPRRPAETGSGEGAEAQWAGLSPVSVASMFSL